MTDPVTPLSGGEEQDLLAAEYALGLLDGEEHAAATARLGDPAFAATVEAWRARASALFAGVAEADAPDLWPAIVARIDDAHTASQPAPQPAPLPLSAANDALPLALNRRLELWRSSAIVATALAAGLAALLVTMPSRYPAPIPPPPTRSPAAGDITFARLATTGGATQVVVRFDPATGRLVARTSDLAAADGQVGVPELWVIAGTRPPRSLGLIANDGRAVLSLDPARARLLRGGVTLAITLEDPVTAPHTAPTGAILATGIAATI